VVKLPVVELNIGKNKITAFKNKLYFRFFPSNSDFQHMNLSEIHSMLAASENKKVDEKQSYLG
jgi:hypothetical protein